MLLPPLAALVFGLPALSVGGESRCPTPAQVSERFEALVAGSAAKGEGHHANLQQMDGAVTVVLQDARGAVVGERSLKSPSCEGLARTAAAVLAAWVANLPSQPEALSAAAARRPIAAPSEARTSASVVDEDSTGASGGLRWRIDAGAVGTTSGGQLGAGGVIGLALGLGDSPWRARLGAQATSPLEHELGPGRVRWIRPALYLGVAAQLLEGANRLEVGVAASAGLLSVHGLGFERDSGAMEFDPGVAMAVRFSRSLPRPGILSLWAELAGTLYLREHQVQVDGIGLGWALPRVAVDLRLGVSFGDL